MKGVAPCRAAHAWLRACWPGVEKGAFAGSRWTSGASAAAPRPPPPGATYCFGGVVYVALTNSCNAGLTMLAANGPNFTFPPGTGFQPLPEGRELTGTEAAEAALLACDALDKEAPSDSGREVVFAGLGEPLVRLPQLLEALSLLRDRSEVRTLRLNTNGLVAAARAPSVAADLQKAGLRRVCVQLQTADPKQHEEMVKPHAGLSHADMCAFTAALASTGLHVDCTAVARPGVDLEAVRALALSLGAATYNTRPYFP
mmetsp:Transcript_50079/g.140425  ORF Transcript_50079/g.140425 Transcript_50079/m.140425 type:complete len:257 (-) Transcript_50079:154-924(-)